MGHYHAFFAIDLYIDGVVKKVSESNIGSYIKCICSKYPALCY